MEPVARSEEELLSENAALRGRLAEYERLEADRKRAAEASRLLAEVSSLFLSERDFPQAVQSALKLCGTSLQGDRVGLFELAESDARIRNSHEWHGEGLSPRLGKLRDLDASRFGWSLEQLRQGKPVTINDVLTLPPDFRKILQEEGVQSLVGHPVFVARKLAGFVVVIAIRRPRAWSAADHSILRQVCELIGEGTERRGSEDRLRESLRQVDEMRRQNDAVLRGTPHGMCLVNQAWRIQWFNRSMMRLIGTGAGTDMNLKGAPFALLFHDREQFDTYRREADHAVRMQGADLRELELKRIDGSPVRVEISLVRHDPTQTAGGYLATLTDVTERHRAEERLRAGEKRFRSIVQNSMDMLMLLDANAGLTYVNPALERTLGRKAEELQGRGALEFVLPEDLPIAQGLLERLHASPGETLPVALRIRSGEGVIRHFEGVATNLLKDASVGAIVLNARDATESIAAREALLRSEALYQSLLEGLTQNVFQKDLDGRFVFVNRRFCETVGHSREELIGRTDFDFFPEELARKYQEDDRKVVESGSTVEMVEEHLSPEGRKLYVQVVKSVVRDATGNPIGMQGIFWDVTEKHEAEEKLRESEARYRDFVDNLPIGIYRTSAGADGRFLAINPAMARMFGFDSVEDLMSRRLDDFHVDEAERDEFRRRLREEGQATDMEMRLRRKDGGIVWVRNTTVVSRDASGRPQYYDGVIRDISLRMQAEAKLRHSEARTRAVLHNLTDAVYEVDLAGNLTYANPALEQMLGYTQEELIGKNNREYMALADQKEVFEAFNQVFRTGEAHTGYEYTLVTKTGERVSVEGSISLVRDASGTPVGFQGMMRDITERKRAREALAEKTGQLERLNHDLLRKNQELDEFTYIASHDLQEPLRKLVAFSEFLRKDVGTDLNPRAEKDLKFIVDAAQRMQTLVQDLLQLSRAGKSAMKREPLKLDDCADRAIDALAVRVETTKATVERSPLPDVWGDRTMLTQLFQNLIGNALKFIPHDRPPVVRVGAERQGDMWLVTVEDNGIGIKPEYAEQIFSPFKRLHGRDKYEGSGIGLSICRKCVERHGGRIWVESEPGVGSRFRFTIGERHQPREGEEEGT